MRRLFATRLPTCGLTSFPRLPGPARRFGDHLSTSAAVARSASRARVLHRRTQMPHSCASPPHATHAAPPLVRVARTRFAPGVLQLRFAPRSARHSSHHSGHSGDQSGSSNSNSGGEGGRGRRSVGWWIMACAAMTAGMVSIGGITRLTESGLSMTDWHPVTGVLPPIGDHEWQAEFERYKTFPEYQRLNQGMSLEEFKGIFFWEWFHRVWGRTIGVVFAVPFLWHLAKGRIRGRLAAQLSALFLMGGAQGALGWYMVKSGLSEELHTSDAPPRVSQYRLAAHLGSAFVIYAGLFWVGLNVLCPTPYAPCIARNAHRSFARLARMSRLNVGLTFATAMTGALVAGLDAGLIYDEFPTMAGSLAPPEESFDLQPLWRNFTENDSLVQWQHRWLAMTTAASVVTMWLMSRGLHRSLPPGVRRLLTMAVVVVAAQTGLGVTTLLSGVHVHVAATHQAGSLTLLTVMLWLTHVLRRIPK